MALEQVCDYPRPPALVPCADQVVVEVLGQRLCDTHHSWRVLETFHPPTYYLPPDAMALSLLRPAPGRSFCEWKGVARYFDVVVDPGGSAERRLHRAVWTYPEPSEPFAALAGWASRKLANRGNSALLVAWVGMAT
jgi:uncharacterized protein (DUF427 family)